MSKERAKRPGRRGPRKATAKYLENAALYYLRRFATSAENLKRVLMRKVERSRHFHGTDAEEGRAHVEDLVRRYRETGLLDDRTYAAAKAEGLRRRGASARVIRGRLREKGVADEVIDGAIEALAEDFQDSELAAAVNLARRRRLGPFAQEAPGARGCPPETKRTGGPTGTKKENPPAGRREKDLAALARAGFSYDVALAVIDAETAEELDDALGPPAPAVGAAPDI